MRKRTALVIAVVSVAALGAARPGMVGRAGQSNDSHDSHEARTLQAFDSMYGVDGPLVGDGFPFATFPATSCPGRSTRCGVGWTPTAT
jgi:hypothetical protein